MLCNYIFFVLFFSLGAITLRAQDAESLEVYVSEQYTELQAHASDNAQEVQNPESEIDDFFAPVEDDGLPLPDFTPPSSVTIFVREYGILALDYSIIAFNKCCYFKRWLTAQCCKKLLALKQLGL
jgi:hypothetical protein